VESNKDGRFLESIACNCEDPMQSVSVTAGISNYQLQSSDEAYVHTTSLEQKSKIFALCPQQGLFLVGIGLLASKYLALKDLLAIKTSTCKHLYYLYFGCDQKKFMTEYTLFAVPGRSQ
jgi:hypothetical protein